MAKNIRGFFENLTDNFLNITVNVNFSGDLTFEYYWALPWNTATIKFKYETKIDGRGPWNILWKNYWAMKYLGLWFLGLRKFFWKICKTLCPTPPLLRT